MFTFLYLDEFANVGAAVCETIMMHIGHHDLHTRSNGVQREIYNL
jgi:hypothetical protein